MGWLGDGYGPWTAGAQDAEAQVGVFVPRLFGQQSNDAAAHLQRRMRRGDDQRDIESVVLVQRQTNGKVIGG